MPRPGKTTPWASSKFQFQSEEAKSRLHTYIDRSSFGGPSQESAIDSDMVLHPLALDGNDSLEQVQIMNTDDCFRLFLIDSTDGPQLTAFLNQSASNVLRTFPAGLLTPIGLVMANPASGKESVYAENFTMSAYHGTVVWSWQQAMMAKGLKVQLDRCNSAKPPDICEEDAVYMAAFRAYNALWDVIEANESILSGEVWSWLYEDGSKFTSLGSLPPPPGVSPTGSYSTVFQNRRIDKLHRIGRSAAVVFDVPGGEEEWWFCAVGGWVLVYWLRSCTLPSSRAPSFLHST